MITIRRSFQICARELSDGETVLYRNPCTINALESSPSMNDFHIVSRIQLAGISVNSTRLQRILLALTLGFAILPAHLRAPVKTPSFAGCSTRFAITERGHLEEHFRWESQLQYVGR